METLVLLVDTILLTALVTLIISSRRWIKSMESEQVPKPFETNIIIESSLSMEL